IFFFHSLPSFLFKLLLSTPTYLFLCYYRFFFNHTPTTEIYTLSLHDALPISCRSASRRLSLRLAGRCGAYRWRPCRDRWLLFDGRSFVPFLETPHAARSAAKSDDRVACGAGSRHRRRVRDAMHQRRAPARVVVRLRELPQGRIDQQLHVPGNDQMDRVGPPL